MLFISSFDFLVFLLIIERAASDVSYNQPSFNACTSWDADGITFSTRNTTGSQPYDIFINTNNTIYATNSETNTIQVWLNKNTTQPITMSSNLANPYSLFVTNNDTIYVNTDNSTGQVSTRLLNTNTSTVAMYVGQVCFGLFVDLNNILYCSIRDLHQVISKSLNSASEVLSIYAGTRCPGSAANQLHSPYGIFVNINFDLYVADCGNNRVQLFQANQSNATTVSISLTLSCPTGVVFDNTNNNLFTVDSGNHRIVRTSSNGSECVVGCSGNSGSTPDHLNNPRNMAFDNYGNIYVTDQNNNRIQMFIRNDICKQTSTAIMITSVVPINNKPCSTPTVTLIPGTSTLSSPIQFRQSQDVYIVSIIKLNCNNSLDITTQWTIKNCSSNCSYQIQLDRTILTTFSELYIPARTLSYGIYELRLTVAMVNMSHLTSSSYVYIEIIPSSTIIPNLIQYGTPTITRGNSQDVQLDPGTYSVDPDGNVFNATNWKYEYYCRIYGLYQFPMFQGSLLPVNDLRNDSSNPSCLSNRTGWQFGNSIQSSLTIRSTSLQPNRTYQFMVLMENRLNASLQAIGYLLVKVKNTPSPMVVIGRVISTMGVPNLEYQLVNPTTQIALFSVCNGNCTTLQNIIWNVYYGTINSSSNVTEWTLFNQTSSYQNIWFFGTNTTNFTATNQLFLLNPQISLWQFEVVYTFISETSSSSLNFAMNQPPYNVSCLISPLNGTTSTLFDISCTGQSAGAEIKGYSVYAWNDDLSERTIVAFSAVSTFQVRLPAGDNQASLLYLVAQIRDTFDCITEYNMSSVTVLPDFAALAILVNDVQNSSSSLTTNPIVQLLANRNQNTVGQLIMSLSQQLNKINSEILDKAVSNGIPAVDISISPLGSQNLQTSSIQWNQSAFIEYNNELNSYANVRDYLITFTTKLAITTSHSITLQATALAQITQATNQLTRAALMIASNRCYQLTIALYTMSTRIPYEDAKTAATQLIQCAANVMTGVNGPLQQRTNILDLDSSRATAFPNDYDTDVELDWSNLNLFADGNDFSWETIQKGRNKYYQQQLANQIVNQMTDLTSLLSSTLNIQLNIGQSLTIDTSQVFMSLETKSIQSLSNKLVKQVGNAQIQLPQVFNSNLSNTSTVSIQSMMKPLAAFGNSKSSSNTNLSRSISLSILDRNGNEVSIQTNATHPIEIIIPRDPNWIIPSMDVQNMTSMNVTPHNQLFHLHYLNITSIPTISIHLEIQPLNTSLGYLLIYKFDQIPQLNSSMNRIDGWTLFCPSSLINESIYKYFIDNQQTPGHQSIVYGIRELNSTEMIAYCSNISLNSNPPIANERFNFTANYGLRVYTSGCYYLDENNQWQSNGLVVGPLTNHNQTQCFSTHLTTFASGFKILPEPKNWSYMFANTDFMKNKIMYLTMICVSLIYILLMVYARYKDTKDIDKLGVTLLPHKNKLHKYFYQIIVFIGQRKDAGTKSNVHCILSGDDDGTHVRTLMDSHRQILQRGRTDTFVMAVLKYLGLLKCTHFIAQQGLAMKKGDGKIERVLPVPNEMEKREFCYITRPSSNQFTRFQRLYYDLSNEAKMANSTDTTRLSFGSLYITPQQIVNDGNHEIFSYMIKRFQRCTGLKKATEEERQVERDERMRSQYYDPIERFPEKTDELLAAFDRLYMTQRAKKTDL